MAKLKSQSTRHITIKESEYLMMYENTMMIEALKIVGIEQIPIYKAMQRVLEDKRVEIHIKPLCTRYAFEKDKAERHE